MTTIGFYRLIFFQSRQLKRFFPIYFHPNCLRRPGYFFFIILKLIVSTLYPEQLGINETYFETFESKYYNQAIEIHNRSSSVIDLTLYKLIAGKMGNIDEKTFIGSRSNNIITWSTSKQANFSAAFTNISFSPLIPSGGVAVIMDPGFRFEESFEFTNNHRTNTLYLLTTSTGVLGTGNFMKEDDVLRLVSIDSNPEDIVDEFHNRISPKGYGVVKIDPSKKGLADNTTSRPQTIGYIETLEDLYTTLPPDRIVLEEINGDPIIVGLPQNYNLTCNYLAIVSQLCNQTIRFYRHDFIKMYHYPNNNANLITDNDDIIFSTGQSDPITLFATEPGLHIISIVDNSFPPLKKTISSFNHSQATEVFITEIYYDTNKNITWMEVYSKNNLTLPLLIQTFNSDYRKNNHFELSKTTLIAGYNVLGYRNQDFSQNFSLADLVIPLPSQFAITTEGVIALSSEGKYLDIVHYDKNWYEDLIKGRSLQRVNNQNYAFIKSQWNVSTEVDSTPFSANVFTRNINFTVSLLSPQLPLSTLKVNFLADFNVNGNLTAYLYDDKGYRIGKVFSQEVLRGYQVPLFICLKEVKSRFGLFPGEYSLMFLFKNTGGTKTLYQNFILE